MEPAPHLSVSNLSKSFGSTRALDSVSLSVQTGTVFGLAGENGAGKSTLIKILCGVHAPDAGEIIVNGGSHRPRDPEEAEKAGISVFHQEIPVCPNLSIAANVFLGPSLPRRGIRPDWRMMNSRCVELYRNLLGEQIDPRQLIRNCTAAEKQLALLVRVLSRDARLIILDEPTTALTGVVAGFLVATLGVNIWIAALAGIAAALALGFLKGLLIATTRINSFIATLSTMMVFRGIAMVISQGQPISFPLSFFMDLFGRAELGGMLPVPVLWFAGWGIAMYVVLHLTTFGVKVYATGDNREAADLAGIKTVRIKRVAFLITSLASGLAALISLSFLKTVTPTQGTGIELEAIAASVIGGTAMSGGVGSIVGTFLGTFIMAEVRTGLVLLGTDAYVQDAFVGLVIALAVIINVRLTSGKK